MAVADASLSTRCGVARRVDRRRDRALGGDGRPVGRPLPGPVRPDHVRRARSIRSRPRGPRIGKPHVSYCLDLYQHGRTADVPAHQRPVTATIAGHLRKTSLVPIISDFLFADASRFIKELSLLNATHDVFLMMVDATLRVSAAAPASAGWIEIFDVETGRTRVVSRAGVSAPRRQSRGVAGRDLPPGARRGPRHRTRRTGPLGDGDGRSSNSWRSGGCGRCREGS